MSTTNSRSSTPNNASSIFPRAAPRPTPSPLNSDQLHSINPSPASALSATVGTPRRASTPLSPGHTPSKFGNGNSQGVAVTGGWNDQPLENFTTANRTWQDSEHSIMAEHRQWGCTWTISAAYPFSQCFSGRWIPHARPAESGTEAARKGVEWFAITAVSFRLFIG